MCGTDYNHNIPRIGHEKAYKLIQKYKSIDALEQDYNTECLNHHRVREIFTVPTKEDVDTDKYTIKTPEIIDKTQVEIILFKSGCSRNIIEMILNTFS
jgi:5'-3' exonuclease